MAWGAKRGSPTPVIQATDRNRLREDIATLAHRRDHAHCIVDMMASDPVAIYHALRTAHLVAVPCLLDEEMLAATANFAEQVSKIGVPARIVVTGVRPGDEFWTPLTRRLWTNGLLTSAVLHHDENLPAAMAQGRTVIETDENGLVAEDMKRVWRGLREAMSRKPEPDAGKQQFPPRTIGVVSDGYGATANLAAHLAVQAIRAGEGPNAVALVASHPDRDLARWIETRVEAGPLFRVANISLLKSVLDWARRLKVRTCVVEAPLTQISGSGSALKSLDLLLIPAPIAELKMVDAKLSLSAGARRNAFVFLRRPNDDFHLTNAADAIHVVGAKLAGVIRFSRDYDEPFDEGSTAMESRPDSRAARDIVELWANIRKIMKRD